MNKYKSLITMFSVAFLVLSRSMTFALEIDVDPDIRCTYKDTNGKKQHKTISESACRAVQAVGEASEAV